MAPVAEGLILDPPEFIENRTAVDLQAEGLEIRAEGLDYGESSAQVEMVRKAIGEGVVDRRWPAVECTVPLIVREEGATSLAGASFPVEAKVGLFQQRGGWIRRDFSDAAGHAGSVGCPVLTAGLTPVQGWLPSHRQVAPDVVLKLSRWPIWYATVAIDGPEVKATAARDLKWEIAEMLGTAPGLIRIRVKNENDTEDFRGLISSIESEHFSDAATADLVYEAEDLTPLGGAKVVAGAGASGGKVVEHTGLTAGWLTILGSEINGVGHMTHTGVRRPRLRVEDPDGGVQLQLEWRSLGASRWSTGPTVDVPVAGDYQTLDLGECRPELALLGEQRWEWRLKARASDGVGRVRVDRVYPVSIEQVCVVSVPAEPPAADLQSTKVPGSAESVAAAERPAWTGLTNLGSSDNARATCALGSFFPEEWSETLSATNLTFGIPVTAEVLGIVVEFERSRLTAKYAYDKRVSLIKGGEVGATNRANKGVNWPSADAYQAYGSEGDLWGDEWTPADINDPNFGVAIEVGGSSGNPGTVGIDHIRITVYYVDEPAEEDRFCFAGRDAELRTDGIVRQGLSDEAWGQLTQESGRLPFAPAGGLEKRGARGLVVVTQGDFDTLADTGDNDFSVLLVYQPGYLSAREAAG